MPCGRGDFFVGHKKDRNFLPEVPVFDLWKNENYSASMAVRISASAGAHGLQGLVQQGVQFPAQHLGALTDHVPGATGGELLVPLNFFFRLDSSMSVQLLLGRILAAAPMSPVSSSVAKSTFSISCSGFTSLHRP